MKNIILTLLLLCSFSTSTEAIVVGMGAGSTSDIFSGVQGKYLLATTTWTDTSGNGYNLTSIGGYCSDPFCTDQASCEDDVEGCGATWSTSEPTASTGHGGGSNKAALFVHSNNDALQTTPTTSNLNITGDITVATWLKLTSTGTQYVMAFNNVTYDKVALVINESGSLSNVSGYLSHDGTSNVMANGATALSSGTPYCVVFVYNQTDARIYINGTLDSNGANNPKSTTGTLYSIADGYLTVGNKGSSSLSFDGVLQNMVILNRAWTAGEVADYCSRGDNI